MIVVIIIIMSLQTSHTMSIIFICTCRHVYSTLHNIIQK